MWCVKNSNAGHNQTKSESFIWLFEQKVNKNQKETSIHNGHKEQKINLRNTGAQRKTRLQDRAQVKAVNSK